MQPDGALLNIDAARYHADDTGRDEPALSASIAHTLIARSPLHAWTEHPKLNPHYERKAEEKFDIGLVVHSIMLDQRPLEEVVHIVHEPSWRTKDAREQRDYARGVGKIPLLFEKAAEVRDMIEAIGDQLARHGADPPVFQDGSPEQTLVWDDEGVWCKARLDWIRNDLRCIDDMKCTSRLGGANPAVFARALFGIGYDLKAAFYVRAIEKLTGERPAFRWLVVETAPPYALSVVEPEPGILELGRSKVDRAMAIWRRCLERDEWPGYPTEVLRAEMPSWEETRWLEREASEDVA